MLGLLLSIWVTLAALIFLVLIAADLRGIIHKEREERVKTKGNYNPKVLVIVPCKGLDIDLYKNLISIKNQGYKNYDLIAVLDYESDPAVQILKKARMKHILSSYKSEKCSGKVRAVITALEKFKNYDAYVIADSDIRVEKGWLRTLITPLADKNIGLSTMFPYFIPESGLWSKVKMVWGFVGDGLMSRKESRFGWGGSLAFRKDLLNKDSFEFFKNSDYSVSDDICLTKICEKSGLRIAYTDKSRPLIHSDDDLGRFSEWSSRQTALSILGNRKNFNQGILFYFAESFIIISGILFAVLISPLFLIFFLHYAKNLAVTYSRIKNGLRRPVIALITLIIPFIYLFNLLKADRMDYIFWRGSRYRIIKTS